MGKKGSWFSAIKRVFVPHSKERLGDESERKPAKEKKKKGFGKLRDGENNSLLPIFREPSSIEKILGEAERDHNLVFRPISPIVISPQTVSPKASSPKPVPPRPVSPLPVSPRLISSRPISPIPIAPKAGPPIPVSPRPVSPRLVSTGATFQSCVSSKADSPRGPSQRAPMPKAPSPRFVQRHKDIAYRPEPNLANQDASAAKIQAAFRGYMVRRNYRALKGRVRLQELVKGQSVKRQTVNAMKHMQLLVRVQTQIQSQRIQMLENQARRQESESALGRLATSEAGHEDWWDGSLLTKEEKEARMLRKVDAAIKRERSMAYACSHQLWKNNPQSASSGIRSGASRLWWNWVDRQLPQANTPPPSQIQTTKDFRLTPTRPNHFRFENTFETPSPKSSILTPTRPIRTPQSQKSFAGTPKFSRGRTKSPFKDDDSLMSCPPLSAPNYMTPTVSARAKGRANSNPKERTIVTPHGETRRLSLPLTQRNISPLKWKKASLFGSGSGSGLGSSCGVVLEKHQSVQSLDNLSVDSTVSKPATARRKPFNRFV